MATGGTETKLCAAEHVTIETTSPQEVWSPGSAEMYKARVWEDLRDLFQQDELTDVMLAAEGQSIPCHRVLLAAASKFFHGKFVLKPESLDHNLLDIEDIDFETLTSIVSYIYSGRLALTVEKTEKLIPASVSLMLPELTKVCKDFLHHNISHETSACIDIHRIARANSLADLAEKAWEVMLEKFQEVSQLDSFKKMPKNELEEYIRDDGLNIASDDPVFEAVVTWVTHDMEKRKSSFENLIENVKLSSCTPRFLGEDVKNEPLMGSSNCLKYLAEALYHHVPSHLGQRGTARRGFNMFSGGNVANTLIAVYADKFWTLKDGESQWVDQGSSQGKKLVYSSACMTGDGIIVTGGSSNGERSKQCWKLTLPKLNWAAMSDLSMAHKEHAAVCVGSRVYLLGGWDGKALSCVEYLDEQTGSWQVAGDMPSGLASLTALSYRNFIFVFGGNKGCAINSLATFITETASNKWSRKADMPGACYAGSSMVYRDRIYVLGGRENCCMSYDPDKDEWKIHSKPAVKHERASAVVWKDRILLCGGEDNSVIEEYNPDTDTWSEWKHQLPQLPAGISPAVFAIKM